MCINYTQLIKHISPCVKVYCKRSFDIIDVCVKMKGKLSYNDQGFLFFLSICVVACCSDVLLSCYVISIKANHVTSFCNIFKHSVQLNKTFTSR